MQDMFLRKKKYMVDTVLVAGAKMHAQTTAPNVRMVIGEIDTTAKSTWCVSRVRSPIARYFSCAALSLRLQALCRALGE